jgi:hypothetical protein
MALLIFARLADTRRPSERPLAMKHDNGFGNRVFIIIFYSFFILF